MSERMQILEMIESGEIFDYFLAEDPHGTTGWYWRLEELPEGPEARYLYLLLASHEFQEGLKNYRDLHYLSRNLEGWQGSIDVFANMLETRKEAFDERLPLVDDALERADIDDLVQTSNNLASVTAQDGAYKVLCLTRGSVDSEKMDLAHAIRAVFELIGGDVALTGEYPGWAPKPDAPIVKLMAALYEERFGEKAPILACHAGLECGILGTNYPDMQMISFGPNIRGAHSPDEKVQISSVQKFWGYLLETLQRIPEKA